jgi:hypothetical protein
MDTITIPKARLAAIIRKFGNLVKAGDGYVLSVPLTECAELGNLEVVPADGAEGTPSIAYVAYKQEKQHVSKADKLTAQTLDQILQQFTLRFTGKPQIKPGAFAIMDGYFAKRQALETTATSCPACGTTDPTKHTSGFPLFLKSENE